MLGNFRSPNVFFEPKSKYIFKILEHQRKSTSDALTTGSDTQKTNSSILYAPTVYEEPLILQNQIHICWRYWLACLVLNAQNSYAGLYFIFELEEFLYFASILFSPLFSSILLLKVVFFLYFKDSYTLFEKVFFEGNKKKSPFLLANHSFFSCYQLKGWETMYSSR